MHDARSDAARAWIQRRTMRYWQSLAMNKLNEFIQLQGWLREIPPILSVSAKELPKNCHEHLGGLYGANI